MAHDFAGTGSAESGTGLNANAKISFAAKLFVPTGHGNAQFDRHVELGGFGAAAGGFTIETPAATGNISVEIFTTSASAVVATYSSFPLDQWFTVVVTSDTTGPSNKVYFNSTTPITETTTTRGALSTSIAFGGATRATATNLCNTTIAEAVYSEGVIWTADQVQMLLDGVSPQLAVPDGIVAYWPMVRDASSIRDVVGGFNAAITGTTAVADHPRTLRPSSRSVFMPISAASSVTITSAQTESGDVTSSTLSPLVQVTAATVESGDSTSSTISPLIQISAATIESGDATPSAIISLVQVAGNVTESGDVTASPVVVLDQIVANQTESGDSVAATISPLVQIAPTQAENGDIQTAGLVSLILVAVNQLETGDATTATVVALLQITSSQTEVGDVAVASVYVLVQISASQSESGDVVVSLIGDTAIILSVASFAVSSTRKSLFSVIATKKRAYEVTI